MLLILRTQDKVTISEMRISIWQQFASNHSAHFTLVGAFESDEWAGVVAYEMRQMLRTIGEWWEQFEDYAPRYAKERELIARGELTPPEQRYKAEYLVDWCRRRGKEVPLDWPHGQWAAGSVTLYENLVFIEPSNNTWMGPVPFDTILSKLGATVAAYCETGNNLAVTIAATAPDEAVAMQMVESIIYKSPSPSVKFFIPVPAFLRSYWSSRGEVTRDGRRVTYHTIDVHIEEDKTRRFLDQAQVFIKIIEYIKSLGCTEISWFFEEVAPW
jgi:hypothetical protein